MAMNAGLKAFIAKKKGAKPNAKAPLGQGGRFAALKQKLGGGAKGAAIAAAIGRKKYGAKKMSKMAATGKGKPFQKDVCPTCGRAM